MDCIPNDGGGGRNRMYDDPGLAGTGGLIAIGGFLFNMTQVMILGAVLIVGGLILMRVAGRDRS